MLATASILRSYSGEAIPDDTGRTAWLIWLSVVTNYPAKAAESYITFPFLGRETTHLFPSRNQYRERYGVGFRHSTPHLAALATARSAETAELKMRMGNVLPPDLRREEFGDQVFVIRSQLVQIRLHFALRVEVIGIERARPA